MSRENWKDYLKKPEVQQMLQDGIRASDPSLEPRHLDERAREKRKEFARSFGLHARIADVTVSKEGDVRVEIAFDEDIELDPDDLKELVINDVPLTGAQLIEVRRIEGDGVKVQATISVNVPRSAIASLRSLPLSVSATTKDDMRLEAFKMA